MFVCVVCCCVCTHGDVTALIMSCTYVRTYTQVQRDPRDNEIVIEYYKTDKALSIIHNLEPKGREIGMSRYN